MHAKQNLKKHDAREKVNDIQRLFLILAPLNNALRE